VPRPNRPLSAAPSLQNARDNNDQSSDEAHRDLLGLSSINTNGRALVASAYFPPQRARPEG